MKTLLSKLLFSAWILLTATFIAQGACTPSFTKSISGLTVIFTNTSTTTSGFPNMVSYAWSFGDGTYSSDKNPVKTFTSAGTKIVQVTMNDSFGCTATMVDTFTLGSAGPGCSASFTKSISGFTVTFTNTSISSGGLSNVHYLWNFSNGQTSTLVNPVTTFLSLGMQVAQLTMYDSSTNCSSSFTDSILITSTTASCFANFSKSATGNTVALTNLSTNTNGLSAGLTYHWSFSDSTSSSLKDPVKVFTTNGLKIISLTIIDSTQGCFATKLDSVMLPSSCAASFTTSVSGLNVTFNNTSTNVDGTNNGLTYQWHFTHDNSIYSSKNLTKTFPSAGYWPVLLTVSDPVQGCLSRISDTLNLTSTCAAHFTKSISGLTATFTNASISSGTNVSYNWSFSDGLSSTLANPVITFPGTGLKTAQLTIFDSSTNCSSTFNDTFVLVFPLGNCAADFTMSASGLTVTLNNTSTGSTPTGVGLTYHWAFSDGDMSDLRNPVKTFASAGTKTISLSINDTLTGCFSNFTDTITLVNPSMCMANFNKTVSGLTVNLTNTSTNTNGSSAGLSYLWFFGDGTSSTATNPTKIFTTGGFQTISLSITDTLQGCYSYKVDTVYLGSATSLCQASFTNVVSGSTVTFMNTSTNTNGTATGLNYLWSFSDGTISTAQNPVKTFTTSGAKIVSLSIMDSISGCFSAATDTIWIAPSTPLCQASFSLAIDTTTPFHFFILNTSTILPGTTFSWDFGDSSTSTLMTPTHTYAHFGKYFVCLTIFHPLCTTTFCDTIGMDSSGMLLKKGAFGFHTLDFTTVNGATGNKEISSTPSYTIYPNPSNGQVYIDYTMQSTSPLLIEVTDITGKVVVSQQTTGLPGTHTQMVDITGLKPAIYFMNIRTTDSQKSFKLIKN